MKQQRPDWITGKKARVLLQVAAKGDPELDAMGVRTVLDVAKTEDQKHMLRAVVGGLAMAKSFFAPPGVPADNMAALRRAFTASARDPELSELLEKLGYDVTYVPPEEIMAILRDAYALDPDLVGKLRAAIQGKK